MAARLRTAGFTVALDHMRGKKSQVEQILLAFGPQVGSDMFDPTIIDELVAQYPQACEMIINHPDFDEPLKLEFAGGNRIWFGECYPSDTDAKSRAVMRVASIIGYEAEGE